MSRVGELNSAGVYTAFILVDQLVLVVEVAIVRSTPLWLGTGALVRIYNRRHHEAGNIWK